MKDVDSGEYEVKLCHYIEQTVTCVTFVGGPGEDGVWITSSNAMTMIV